MLQLTPATCCSRHTWQQQEERIGSETSSTHTTVRFVFLLCSARRGRWSGEPARGRGPGARGGSVLASVSVDFITGHLKRGDKQWAARTVRYVRLMTHSRHFSCSSYDLHCIVSLALRSLNSHLERDNDTTWHC